MLANHQLLTGCGLVLMLLFAVSHGYSDHPHIQLDGEFSDWNSSDLVADDPIGDADGSVFDFTRVFARMAGSTLFVRFDTQLETNLQAGRDSDGELHVTVDLPRSRKLKIDLRGRAASIHSPDSVSTVPWRDIRFSSLPTYAAKDFEFRVDLGSLGVRAGDTIALNFEGSDMLAEPVSLTIDESNRESVAPGDLSKREGTTRVASLNTLKQGSASAERAPSIKKLFGFADADIYCFNESLDEKTFRSTCFNVLPESFAGTKNVHWASTCGIVSRYPLTPLDFNCREAAALIQPPGKNGIVVVSVHFKCCGFNGSDEDRRRIQEVKALLSDLQRMRNGEFGPEAANAAVVVLGDFNLVGSRTPLDMVNAAGLNDVMLRSPVDGSAMTWRGISSRESFWPGRLDYVAVDGERIESTSGFILNTEQLNTLDAAQATDVLASDHSMLVVDLNSL